MKNSTIYALTFFLFSLICTKPLQAQILKNILNTVKSTAESRANDKAANATNSAIDKILTKKDSSNKVLDAFAKATQQNPNDTSAADLTMKALGILTGGSGVSPADSAAAIKNFSTATGGAGFYYETTNTVVSKNGTVQSINKTWFTSSGEGRVEMNLAAMMGANGAAPMIGLSRLSFPGYSILLDNTNKNYFLSIIDTALLNAANTKYTVTKIGTETINGYSCVHSKLSTSGRNSSDMDIWTSKNVPGYSLLEKAMSSTKSFTTPDMLHALQQAGADGYFVKLEIKNKDISSTMLLTKVEQKSLPSSLFEIPNGYTETGNNPVIGNMFQAAQKQQ